jgi:hypothetical protein
MKFLLVILFISSSELGEQPKHPVRYSAEAQEQCETMCLQCVAAGSEPEECADDFRFKVCCHQSGGRANGCGCREVL